MKSGSFRSQWDIYTNAWSETNKIERQKIFEQCLHLDCVYTDPRIQVTGHDNLSNYVSEFQRNVPGGRFVITGFKEHHERSLAHWDMVDQKANILAQGASFAIYGPDGRLRQITGFF